MSEAKDIENKDVFYTQLLSKAGVAMAVIAGVAVFELWLLPPFSGTFWLSWSIFILALIKTYFIVRLSFDQLMKIIGQSHLLSHILVLFGLLISLIIISFALDFTALDFFDQNNFKPGAYDTGGNPFKIAYEYLYFSTVTFSSVGYGDIVPVSAIAKALVMLEVALRFFVLVFGIANINQIRINNNNNE